MTIEVEEAAADSSLRLELRPFRGIVRRLRQDAERRSYFGDKRSHGRTPVRRTVYLTPATLQGNQLELFSRAQAHTIGYTMQVSTHGLVFTHDEPILTSHLIATFDLLDSEPVSLLLQIQWSRCRGDRWYLSGGKFIAATDTPPLLHYIPEHGTSNN